jgi:uncharacterized protein (TIGR00290 family)
VVIVVRTVAGIALMDLKKKVTISWSGGKDSALALYKIISSGEFDIVHLHTVIDNDSKRVGLHGVKEELIERQARALGLKLVKLYLPATEDHAAYESLMRTFYSACKTDNITGVVFGDIFLEDLKTFREKMLEASGATGIFPLWKKDSRALIKEFLEVGFKTLLCSANASIFQSSDLGKTLDEDFIRSIPSAADVCGENGEFHTFVYDGPIFNSPISIEKGAVVKKHYNYKIKQTDGTIQEINAAFWFQELL